MLMPLAGAEELDGLIADLQRALARCDAAGVGPAASINLNLAVDYAGMGAVPANAVPLGSPRV